MGNSTFYIIKWRCFCANIETQVWVFLNDLCSEVLLEHAGLTRMYQDQ